MTAAGPLEIGSLAPDEDIAPIIAWAFADTPDGARGWLAGAGLENARVARLSGKPVGGLLTVPMGQWFGGKSVPMLGIAGVAVAPEARGHGTALALMRATLREARERGFFLSALYPASVALYRAVGYELAGSRFRHTARLKSLPREAGALKVEPIGEADAPAIEATYAEWARTRPGSLDRGSYVWGRVRKPRDGGARGFLVRGGAGIEGYLYAAQRRSGAMAHDLALSDFVGLTPAAIRTLLRLLSDHQTTAEHAVWFGACPDPAVFELPERVITGELFEHWMLRIVDAPAALTRRGYPPMSGAIDFELHDELFASTPERFRLEVHESGEANVTHGGSGTVRLDARALAVLYSGFLSASELGRAGRIVADAGTLAVLDRLFAGPAPAMGDFF